ncbi:MAG TPA: DUF1501 domain-containing protein, partial [Steroidobacteraceae bacterium]|nr:DUF1501 domain-containing protein [Steroidobacteraceae bacterium]
GVSSSLNTLDLASAGTAYANEYAFVADIASRSDKYAQRVKDTYAAGKALLKGQYSNDSFGTQMANCAALIAGGMQTKVYYTSLGGFDTHVSQAQQGDGTIGLHNTLLSSLSYVIYQFMNDMIRLNLAHRIVGMTVSEFGRRPSENGSFGTDHGAGGVQFIFGTQVNSGIFGQQFDLSNLDENQNLSYQIDYRSVYLDVLTAWFGMTLADAKATLKTGLSGEADAEVDLLGPIAVIKQQSGGVATSKPAELPFEITANYPNPFTTSTTLVINVPSEASVALDITNMNGDRVADVFSQTLGVGEHRVPLSLDLPSGFYIVRARSSIGVVTKMIQCVR